MERSNIRNSIRSAMPAPGFRYYATVRYIQPMARTKASRMRAAVRTSAARPAGVPKVYGRIQKALERDHFGSYVMINIDTSDYVVAATTSEVHAKFIDKFGDCAPGWCTRIGASAFATA